LLPLLHFLPIENHLASFGSRPPLKARQIQPFEADLDGRAFKNLKIENEAQLSRSGKAN
jgi:hypothetical protein